MEETGERGVAGGGGSWWEGGGVSPRGPGDV